MSEQKDVLPGGAVGPTEAESGQEGANEKIQSSIFSEKGGQSASTLEVSEDNDTKLDAASKSEVSVVKGRDLDPKKAETPAQEESVATDGVQKKLPPANLGKITVLNEKETTETKTTKGVEKKVSLPTATQW